MGSDSGEHFRLPTFTQADEAIGIAGGIPHAFRHTGVEREKYYPAPDDFRQ